MLVLLIVIMIIVGLFRNMERKVIGSVVVTVATR